MNQFYPGQEVVCVNARQPANTTLPSELVEGRTYRLRWVGIHKHYLDGEYLGVRVEGIDRGTCQIWGDVDTPYAARRFRPLVKDPLAVFRQIAADPHGFKVTGPEGPTRTPGGEPAKREKVKEEV